MVIPLSKHALVVYNPRAGSAGCGIEGHLGKICDFLSRELNYRISIRQSQRKFSDGMLDDVPADACDLIVVVGGDGTVKSVLGALEPQHVQTPVAIVPLGTANFLARATGVYPTSDSSKFLDQFMDLYFPQASTDEVIDFSLKIIGAGTTGACDIANVNGETLAIAGGMGSLSDAVILPKEKHKQFWRMFAFAPLFMKAFSKPLRSYYVKVDDGPAEKIRAQGIFFVNVPHFGLGGWWRLDELQDGLVDMVIMDPEGMKQFGQFVGELGAWIATSDFGHIPFRVRRVRCAEVELVTEENDAGTLARGGTVMVDGESVGRGPLVLDVRRHAANFCLPPWAVEHQKSYEKVHVRTR